MPGQFPLAAGVRDIGSASMGYVPVIYSGKLLKKFYDATVLSEIANTDYEGEIKQMGDQVIIRSVPDITVRPYKNGQTLTNEQPESTVVTLNINKGDYWSFVTKKVDDKQTDIKSYVEKWTEDASSRLKIAIDTAVLGDVYADADAANMGAAAGVKSGDINLGTTGTPVVLTKADVLDYIVDCGTVLDEIGRAHV